MEMLMDGYERGQVAGRSSARAQVLARGPALEGASSGVGEARVPAAGCHGREEGGRRQTPLGNLIG